MQQNLFTAGEMTTSSPTITKPNVMRSKFYHGDCLIEMDKIADKSIDMILCDLPYGTTQCKWDVVINFNKLWEQYKRIIKDNSAIVLFGREPFTSLMVTSNIKCYKHKLIWNKKQSGSAINAKYMPLQIDEDIIVFSKGKVNYYPKMRKGKMRKRGGYKEGNNIMGKLKEFENYSDEYFPVNIIEFANPRTGKLHPTEKPIAVIKTLIEYYSNEGETILDNCMGSGTTGVACQNTNRHFIGIEQDKKYFDIAVKRVSECNYFDDENDDYDDIDDEGCEFCNLAHCSGSCAEEDWG